MTKLPIINMPHAQKRMELSKFRFKEPASSAIDRFAVQSIMSLSQRLRAIQISAAMPLVSLDQATLEDLSQEVITFGQAHMNQTYEQAWEDQEWVQFMVKRYQNSSKEAHVRFIKFVELKVNQIESLQEPVMPATRASGAVMPTAKPKAAPKSMGRRQPVPDSEVDWDVEPEMYDPLTMSSHQSASTEEFVALQQRVLKMEQALTSVVQHLDRQYAEEN